MRDSFSRFLGLALALVLLVGCGSMPLGKADRAMLLDGAVNNYRKLIRWGYYDEAAKYLREADGRAFTGDLKNAARYRVTNYTIASQILADDGKEARIIAVIEYYELDAGVIRTLHDEQMWWYDAKEKRWYLRTPLPHFGSDEDEVKPGVTTGGPPPAPVPADKFAPKAAAAP